MSNLATAVMALDGRVFVLTDEGEQEWTIERLFEEAWNNPTSHHSLKPGNLIVRVVVPDEGRRSHYLQQSEKAEFDWALVSVAASAKIKDGVLRDPRLVLGCVAPGPYQVAEVNALLEGKRLTEDLATKAAEKLLQGAEPTPDNAYKVPLAKTLARRCLMQLVG